MTVLRIDIKQYIFSGKHEHRTAFDKFKTKFENCEQKSWTNRLRIMVSPLNFEDKKKMLFDCLTTAEQCIKGTSLEQKDQSHEEQTQRKQSKEVSRRFQGKESIFKRPQDPIRKCLRPRRVPDFQVRVNL